MMKPHRKKHLPVILRITTVCTILLLATHSIADTKQAAKQKFKSGIAFFEKEDYPMALSAFEASYELRESTVVLFNIGMCQKALFRYAESMATFKKLLQLPAKKIKPSIRRDVKDAIEDIKKTGGRLRIEHWLEGTTLKLDGRPLPNDYDPADPIWVAIGNHTLQISKTGYVTKEIKFNAIQGKTETIDGQLEVSVSRLVVQCPQDAKVYLNNKEAGTCPFDEPVEPGRWKVTISAPGKNRFESDIVAEPGNTVSLIVNLDKAKPSTLAEDSVEKQASDTPMHMTKRSIILLTSGIASTVLGLTGLGLGIGYSAAYNKEYDNVMKIYNDALLARKNGNEKEYNEYRSSLDTATDKLETPKYHRGMLIGYTVGGVLTAAGVACLIVFGLQKKKKIVAVQPSPYGLSIVF